MTEVGLAVGTVLRRAMGAAAEVLEGRHFLVHGEEHVTSRTARPSGRFTVEAAAHLSKRNRSGPTVAGTKMDPHPIYKHGPSSPYEGWRVRTLSV